MVNGTTDRLSNETQTSTQMSSTSETTSINKADGTDELYSAMGAVVGVVVVIIVVTIVCFVYRSQRQSRLNILRMKTNKRRPAALSMELVDTDEHNVMFRGVHQPLYGADRPSSMASFQNRGSGIEEPQYVNTGANLLKPDEIIENNISVSEPNKEEKQTTGDEETDASNIHPHDVPKPTKHTYDIPKSSGNTYKLENTIDNGNDDQKPTRSFLHNGPIEKPLKQEGKFMDFDKLLKSPPPPCKYNSKYVNTQGYINCSPFADSLESANESGVDKYVNVTGMLGRRGHSTSVLTNKYDEYESPVSSKLNTWVSEDTYLPMDVQSNFQLLNIKPGGNDDTTNDSTDPSDDSINYQNMKFHARGKNDIRNAATRATAPPGAHMFSENDDEQVYVAPDNDGVHSGSVKYVNCERSRSTEDIYIYADPDKLKKISV